MSSCCDIQQNHYTNYYSIISFGRRKLLFILIQQKQSSLHSLNVIELMFNPEEGAAMNRKHHRFVPFKCCLCPAHRLSVQFTGLLVCDHSNCATVASIVPL